MEASTNLGNLTDLETVDKHRASFNRKIAEMQVAASKNSKFLTRADQDNKVARLLALNNLGEKPTLEDMNPTRSLREALKKKYGIIWEFFPTRGGGLPSSQNFCYFTIALKNP